MAKASSVASTSDIKSVSSPSQSASSPTETNSSFTKSGQEQLLSELEDQDGAGENSKLAIDSGSIRKEDHTVHCTGGTKAKIRTCAAEKNIVESTAGSPETIDDDDISATGGVGFNPTRDNLTDGLVGLLRPSLEALDNGVCNTRDAQNELKERITALEQQLLAIEAEQSCPLDLETYINKLQASKKRILVVNTILQGAQVNCFITNPV